MTLKDSSSGAATPQTIGKYTILGTLGRGSMGVVYKGQDPEIGRIVAVKTLRKLVATQLHDADQALERFKIEARSAGNLRHSNIITIFDVSVEGATPYIVMDYVEGSSLDQVILKNTKLPIGQTLQYLEQVAAALDYAHEKGVIHRDIKPSNILVDNRGVVFVLDFGIARINDSLQETQNTAKPEPVMGTPGYMSPEQILNKELNHRSDLFSLAVVAFECLTGKRPFQGKSYTEVLSNILNKPPTPLRELVDLPEALEQQFDRAFSKDASKRFASAKELVQAFRAAVGLNSDSSLTARPDSGSSRSSSGQWKPLTGSEKTGSPEEREEANKHLLRHPSYSAPGDLFSDGDPIRRASSDMLIRVHRKRYGKIMMTLFFLIFVLVWCLFEVIGVQAPDTISVASNNTTPAETSAPIILNTTGSEQVPVKIDSENGREILIDLPQTKIAPGGVSIAELDDRQLLGLIAESSTSERDLVEAMNEAEARHLNALVEVTVKPLKNDSSAVRLAAVKLLGRIKDARAVAILVPLLDDYDPIVRGYTARALGDIGSRKALAYLKVRYSKEEVSSVKETVQAAIEKINGFPMQ